MDLSHHPHADSFRAECHAFADWLLNRLVGRSAFVCVLAERKP